MKNKSITLKQQQGMVIVIALFIVALIAALAVAMMQRLDRSLLRTSLLLHDEQSLQYMQGAVEWAILQLQQDWKNQQAGKIIDALPMHMPAQQVHGYQIEASITDLQGLFNLNNLTPDNVAAQQGFLQLLNLLAPSMSIDAKKNLITAIGDWMTASNLNGDSYDAYYAKASPPYRARHQLMLDVSELMFVKGMSLDLYQKLKPYITVLPNTTALNVQTMPAALFVVLAPGVTQDMGDELVALRQSIPFTAVDAFLNSPMLKGLTIAMNITVTSQYFLVETHVNIAAQKQVFYTVLQRNTQNQPVQVTIISQSMER